MDACRCTLGSWRSPAKFVSFGQGRQTFGSGVTYLSTLLLCRRLASINFCIVNRINLLCTLELCLLAWDRVSEAYSSRWTPHSILASPRTSNLDRRRLPPNTDLAHSVTSRPNPAVRFPRSAPSPSRSRPPLAPCPGAGPTQGAAASWPLLHRMLNSTRRPPPTCECGLAFHFDETFVDPLI